MNILQFLDTPELMGDIFRGDSWEAWRAVLSAAFCVPMDEHRMALFAAVSGGRKPPSERVRELYAVVGRRAAKTHTAGAVALYLATVGAELGNLNAKLSPGERGVIALIAVNKPQATLAMGYILGAIDNSPTLSNMVLHRGRTAVEFTNNTVIEVHSNNFRAIRGRTLLALLMDEVAFFRSEESANPDFELYRAALPGLATTGGLLFGFSSPYARRGLLYDKHRKHFGQDGDVLVVQGSTQDFNPTIDPRIIEEALADDPEGARAEWLGEFRSDLEAFISREVIESLVRPSPLELPYNRTHRYFGFVDPAGGGQDDFTMAIAHLEETTVVIDVVRGLKGVPADIVAEYAPILKSYRIPEVKGDHYAGSWPADEFRKHGIRFTNADKPKSGLYQDCLPMLNSGRVQLPPHAKLVNQFCSLERRTSRSGRDSIDHPPSGHDDLANAVAGAAVHTTKPAGKMSVVRVAGAF